MKTNPTSPLFSLLPLVTLLVALVGCGASDAPVTTQNSEDAGRVYGSGEGVDPANAEVKLALDANISAPTAKSMNLSVPNFTAVFNVADHMQVMRCAKSFILRTPDGRDAATVVVQSIKDSENMRYAWVNALSHTADCGLIGNRISREDFFDLTAKSGQFFYVLNPCIDSSRSVYQNINHPQQCSYKLKFTKALNFVSSLSTDALSLAQQLNEAEGRFSATFTQMRSLASYIQLKQFSCVQEAVVDQARRAAFNMVTQLATLAVPSVATTLVSGPLGDILGVRNILDVAKMFVFGNDGSQHGSNGSVACPVADDLQNQFNTVSGSVDTALKSVVDIRNQLAKLNGLTDIIDLTMKP